VAGLVAGIQGLAGVVPGQCSACGVENDAEWGLVIRRDRSRDMTAYLRLCDDCYRRLMAHLLETPDRGREPLRGYT
jgi:hypothetical protein